MAEECYRLAVQFRPEMAVAYLNLGVVKAEQQQKEAAKAVRTNSGPQIRELGDAKPPRRNLAPQKFFELLFIIFSIFLPSPKRVFAPLNIFLPYHSMFSSCGPELISSLTIFGN